MYRVNDIVLFIERNICDIIKMQANFIGIKTNVKDVSMIINGDSISSYKVDSVLMIYNMGRTWKYVLETANKPLTSDFINNIHSMLSAGVYTNIVDLIYNNEVYKLSELCMNDMLNILVNRVYDEDVSRFIDVALYIIYNKLFGNWSTLIASYVLTKLLMQNGVGIFYICQRYWDEFNTQLRSYLLTHNNENIKFIIKNKCIIGLKDR